MGELLGKLTEREGNLVKATQAHYLGFLTAAEVVALKQLLHAVPASNPRVAAETAAMMNILEIAECARVGLLYSIG